MAERLKIATLDEGGIQGKYCGIDKMRKLYGDGQTLTNWMSYTCKLYTSTVGDTRKVNEWRAMYERSGYHIVHGLHNATNGSRRGAATLLMKMYTFNLTENDSEVQLSPGGEIAIANSSQESTMESYDTNTTEPRKQAYTLYAPVNADERRTFLKQQIYSD